jgi:phosphonate metabolism protein (transferase hexapeptide repeat family)
MSTTAGVSNTIEAVSKTLHRGPSIDATAVVRRSRLGAWTEVGPGWSILESTMDDYSYAAGSHGIIHYTRVGKFCSLASHVVLNPGNHPMHRVSQHHFTYRRHQYEMGPDDPILFEQRRNYACHIGHDVWVGHGAKIMGGVSVGIGAVVGAGAVVTRQVLPYQVVAGVPAKPIRDRFPDAVVEKLLASRWWDWSHETLRARLDDMMDVDRFLAQYG